MELSGNSVRVCFLPYSTNVNRKIFIQYWTNTFDYKYIYLNEYVSSFFNVNLLAKNEIKHSEVNCLIPSISINSLIYCFLTGILFDIRWNDLISYNTENKEKYIFYKSILKKDISIILKVLKKLNNNVKCYVKKTFCSQTYCVSKLPPHDTKYSYRNISFKILPINTSEKTFLYEKFHFKINLPKTITHIEYYNSDMTSQDATSYLDSTNTMSVIEYIEQEFYDGNEIILEINEPENNNILNGTITNSTIDFFKVFLNDNIDYGELFIVDTEDRTVKNLSLDIFCDIKKENMDNGKIYLVSNKDHIFARLYCNLNTYLCIEDFNQLYLDCNKNIEKFTVDILKLFTNKRYLYLKIDKYNIHWHFKTIRLVPRIMYKFKFNIDDNFKKYISYIGLIYYFPYSFSGRNKQYSVYFNLL